MDNFKINPCKACREKCEITDINCINNCCSDTISAFKGAWSINQIRNSPEFKNCVSCLNDSIRCVGSDTCELRLTAAPTWNQVPHYFPELLQEYKDVNKAKKACYDFCLDCKYTNSCMQNCDIDSLAVETYDNKNIKSLKDDKPTDDNKPGYNQTNPVSFYTGFILGSILFIFIIYLFLQILLE